MKYLWLLFFTIPAFGEKMHPALADQVRHRGQASAFIHLENSASLERTPLIKDRTERIRFVYDQLRFQALRTQGPVIEKLKSRGIQYQAFYIENSILIENANESLLSEISTWPEVISMSLNPKLILKTIDWQKALSFSFPNYSLNNQGRGPEAHLTRLKIPQVWNELKNRGQGIVIGNQDTGFLWTHSALKRQYRGFGGLNVNHMYNWMDAFGVMTEPEDDQGHGTHTLGSMIGDDGKKNQIGAAPDAKWIGCRNMNKGVGSVAAYLTCFQFFLAPYPMGGDPARDGRPELAPHIVNNSWSCSEKEGCRSNELLGALQAHKAAGILNVVAAGNYGPQCGTVATAPAKYTDEVLSVGAYNRYMNEAASFSGRGPSSWSGKLAPDITAYGEIIRSSVYSGNDSYDDKGGTSMASPQIAGGIALLWSSRPRLIGQIDETFQIVRGQAQGLTSRESCPGFPGSKIPNASFGYGMADFYQAIVSTAP